MYLNETVGRLATRLILEFRSAEDDIREFGRRYKEEYGVEPKRESQTVYTVPFSPDKETTLRQITVLFIGLGYRRGKTYGDGSVDLYKRVWMVKVIVSPEDIIVGWMKAPTIKVPTTGWHPAKVKEPVKSEV